MKTWMLTLVGVLTSLACYANPTQSGLTITTDDQPLSPTLTQALPNPLPDDGQQPTQPNQPNHPGQPGQPGQPSQGNPNYGQTYQYNFGQVPVNQSRWARFTLRSTGPGPLYINQVALYGQGFFGRTTCPGILYPGQICDATVEFRPWYQGGYNGQLIFYTSAGQSVVYLYGWGIRW